VDYILLQITSYDNRKYIFTFLLPTCSINTPPPPRLFMIAGPFASNTVKKNSKLFSLGSIVNRVNIQRVGIIKILKKKCICKAAEKWPWVYFPRFSVLIFNGEKVPEVQYSTLKNEPQFNFQPGSKYLHRSIGDAYSSQASALTSGIFRGSCLSCSQICVSYRADEIDDCSLFMLFYEYINSKGVCYRSECYIL
jgi:hypothetical protein